MTDEEIIKAIELIGKLKDHVASIPSKGALDRHCGYCLEPITGSCVGSMPSQNPNGCSYHMDCFQMLRAYEEMFAIGRLLDGAPVLAKNYISKKYKAAQKHFAYTFLEYVVDNNIDVGYVEESLHRMWNKYGGYDVILKELDDQRKSWGWPRLIKDQEKEENNG